MDISNLKTQIEADISNVTGATPLEDLLALAKSADSVGADRTPLDTELQSRITALTGTELLEDNLALAKSVSASSTFRNYQQHLSTTTFTVPVGVYTIGFLIAGGGGNGANGSLSGGGGGGAAGATIGGMLLVKPGDVLDLTVGAASGDTSIYRGTQILAVAQGGRNGSGTTRGVGSPSYSLAHSPILISGGDGGDGGSTVAGFSGKPPKASAIGTTTNEFLVAQIPVSSGGTGNNPQGGGGGGGSSYYGVGGDGGNSGNPLTGENGSTPLATAYGAGGGGGGEGEETSGVGGSGIQGIIELWW